MPPVNASNGEIEIFLKRSHDVIKDYLIQQGVTLPPGSLASYDPASSTLALRAMAVVHDLVYMNGGQRGLQVRLSPQDALKALGAIAAPLVA